MNTTTKFLAAGLMLILSIAATGCGAGRIFSRYASANDAQVDAIAAEIAGFDVPQGYHPSYALTLQDYAIAAYSPRDNHSHLVLIQAPQDFDLASFDPATVLVDRSPTAVPVRVEVVETRDVVIREATVQMIVSEGVSGSDGTAYREISAAFAGKNGPAFLIWNEPVDRWDWEKVDALLASIN